MTFLQTFLEGLISFVSPCMLPMLPLYVSYFAADGADARRTAVRSAAFVTGFLVVFVTLGVFAGSLGTVLATHRTALSVTCGVAVILFGLGYLGLFRLPFTGVRGGRRLDGVVPAFLFGLIYSVNLTPCVGAFLASALALAASEGGAAKGAALLLTYSCGLGVPFVLSALLMGRLTGAFGFIKRNYRVINPVCGALLLLFGAWMIAEPWLKASGAAARVAERSQEQQEREGTKMEIELTSANFEAEVLKADRPVLVDFWATWCGPCRMLAPLVEEVASEKADVLKVGKVNVDEAPDIAAKYGIMSIPTLILFKDGKAVAQSLGYISKDELLRFVAQ